jgi:hypothetical protein
VEIMRGKPLVGEEYYRVAILGWVAELVSDMNKPNISSPVGLHPHCFPVL